MKRRKKKVSLPHLTILAMNRRDLALFCERMLSLASLVNDLRLQVDRLSKTQARRKPNAEPPVKPRMSEERSDTFIN